MKAILVENPFDIKIVTIPKPQIQKSTDVLIRVRFGGICGSDIGIYAGTNSLATYPRVIGHEFSGVVEETGSDVTGIFPGDCVTVDPVRSCGHCYACRNGHHNVCRNLQVVGVHCDGGFAQYVVAPQDAVYPVDPQKIPEEWMCLVEPYSIGVEINNRAEIALNDQVLVMGSGPIGIAVMQVAKARGAAVMMTDLLEERLNRAADMGADVIIDTSCQDISKAVSAFTGGEGMPVIVDTICQAWSFELAVALSCPAGRIIVLGTGQSVSSIAQVDITKKGLNILGSRLNNHRFSETISLFEQGLVTPGKMKTNEFHFTDVAHAIAHLREHPESTCKIVLRFD